MLVSDGCQHGNIPANMQFVLRLGQIMSILVFISTMLGSELSLMALSPRLAWLRLYSQIPVPNRDARIKHRLHQVSTPSGLSPAPTRLRPLVVSGGNHGATQ